MCGSATFTTVASSTTMSWAVAMTSSARPRLAAVVCRVAGPRPIRGICDMCPFLSMLAAFAVPPSSCDGSDFCLVSGDAARSRVPRGE